MLEAINKHWREYLMEAWGLGTFMISACAFGVLFFHNDSPFAAADLTLRSALTGIAMGATAIAIFLSPWGRRSGAHINPSVTLTFWRLGKVGGWDAAFYILAQFAGAVSGVWVSSLVFGALIAGSDVNFVVTVPGAGGAGAAFIAEAVISFFMMMTVLISSNSAKLSRFTPFFAGTLVAVFIALEAPFSGMSMNPARTFGSAVVAGRWNSIWIYFAAPPLAMLLAAEVYVRAKGLKEVYCAKFYHARNAPCIFNCRFGELGKKENAIEATKQKALFPPVTGLF